MATVRKPPTVGQSAAALAVMLVAVAVPAVAVIFAPGPLWTRMIAGSCGFVLAFVGGAFIVREILGIETDAEPHAVPAPGPRDTVHRIAYDDRGQGCTDPAEHEPHRWFWSAELPFKTLTPTGEWVTGTTPVSGSQWCRGVPPS